MDHTSIKDLFRAKAQSFEETGKVESSIFLRLCVTFAALRETGLTIKRRD
jgi:hypothetical protein